MNGRTGLWRGLLTLTTLVGLISPVLGQSSKTLAVVNGQPITQEDTDAILKRQPPAAAPLTEEQRRQAQSTALDFLINETIMKQFLQRALAGKPPLALDSPQVTKYLREFEEALHKKKQTLAEFLKESSQTEKELRADIVKEMQWEAYITEHLSESDMEQYYEENKAFFDKVVVRASHILIRVPQDAPASDRAAARTKLLRLREAIAAGQLDFAEAAKKYSDCSSKTQGGDLGFFPRKFVVLEPFAQAAFALKKGELSGVVETEYGLHLIKVMDRSPGEPSEYTKVKSEVRRLCMMELANRIIAREHKAAKIELAPK